MGVIDSPPATRILAVPLSGQAYSPVSAMLSGSIVGLTAESSCRSSRDSTCAGTTFSIRRRREFRRREMRTERTEKRLSQLVSNMRGCLWEFRCVLNRIVSNTRPSFGSLSEGYELPTRNLSRLLRISKIAESSIVCRSKQIRRFRLIAEAAGLNDVSGHIKPEN